MKKTKIVFPAFLGILLMISLLFTSPVNATISYYNHIQNPSFLSYSNYIEDGGFESGSFESGVLYGNFSIFTGSPSITTDRSNTGVYSFYGEGTTNLGIYNFTSPYNNILGADIVSVTAYYYQMEAGINYAYMMFYYSDDTSLEVNLNATLNNWVEVDFTSYVNNAKYLIAFSFGGGSGCQMGVDDVVLLVDDGGGQDSLSSDSTPWKAGGQRSSGYSLNDIVDIVDDVGRLDDYSLRYANEDGMGVLQGIPYLDTDLVHFIDCYVYTSDSTELYIEVLLTYSDGSYDSKYEYFNTNGTWTYINFGQSWISSGKTIKRCSFHVSVYSSYTGTYHAFNGEIYIDDVGIWSSVEYGFTRFSFSIIPIPIESGISYFKTYCQTTYTINVNIYNTTSGEMDEEGIYYYSDAFGSQTGDMINGFFQIVLNKRTYTLSPYTLETIALTVTTNSSVFSVEILSYWYPTEGVSVTDIDTTVTTDFMFLFIFIVIPSMFLAVILKSVGLPIIGFLSGLTIMSAIGNTVGIVDLWFLFVMVLVVILLILAMMKRGIYT